MTIKQTTTYDWTARSLSEDEIDNIVQSFGDAAERVMQAGFDGVQIHGAHGYLISQFLSNHVNTRDDKWGGSLENRMKLLMEVYHEVRKCVGNHPILLKTNCDDFYPGSFTIEESVEVSKRICEKGLDGSIDVESKKPITIFTIKIPLEEKDA